MASIYDWSSTASDNGTADADINFAEGQPPSSVNDSARMLMKRVRDLLTDIGGVTAAGSANAITLTSATGFAALNDGLIVCFRAAADNTSATTLNANSLGPKSLRKMTGSGEAALAGGEVQATGIYIAVYSEALNSAAGGWLLLNPTDLPPDIAPVIAAAGAKTAPVDADAVPLIDSAASNVLKKVTWANIKATLKTYFDTIYAAVVHTHTITEGGSWLIPIVVNGDYVVIQNAPFGGTITQTTSQADSGTATATFKVNSSAIGGAAHAVSSSEVVTSRSSSNTFAAGDDIVVTISSNAACLNARLALKYTRVI